MSNIKKYVLAIWVTALIACSGIVVVAINVIHHHQVTAQEISLCHAKASERFAADSVALKWGSTDTLGSGNYLLHAMASQSLVSMPVHLTCHVNGGSPFFTDGGFGE